MISLTDNLQVPESAHILYIFEEKQLYLENLLAYMKTGVKLGHYVIVIENKAILNEISSRLETLFSKEEQSMLHFVDNYEFYGYFGDFHKHHIVSHFAEIVNPYLAENKIIRTWAHVEWKEQDDISSKILEFEHLADTSVNELETMSVCAYFATDINAFLEINMMESHEFLMTDNEFVQSSLYRKKHYSPDKNSNKYSY